jgi:hypothetical protein
MMPASGASPYRQSVGVPAVEGRLSATSIQPRSARNLESQTERRSQAQARASDEFSVHIVGQLEVIAWATPHRKGGALSDSCELPDDDGWLYELKLDGYRAWHSRQAGRSTSDPETTMISFAGGLRSLPAPPEPQHQTASLVHKPARSVLRGAILVEVAPRFRKG